MMALSGLARSIRGDMTEPKPSRTEIFRFPSYLSLRAKERELEADKNCVAGHVFINDRAEHWVIKAEFKK